MTAQIVKFNDARRRLIERRCRHRIGDRVQLTANRFGRILDIEIAGSGFGLLVGREDDATTIRVRDFEVRPASPKRGRP